MATAVLTARPAAAAWSVSSVDLGSLGGGSSQATAMNDSGQIVGVPNNTDAAKAATDLWCIADKLAGKSVDKAASTPGARASDVANAQRQLVAARQRWSVDHTDAVERLKQAWRTAEGAVR